MHLYRFVEGDLYEETRESWFEHPEEMPSEQIVELLVETWGKLRTTVKEDGLVHRDQVFAEAGFRRVRPEVSVHLGRSFWPEQVSVDYMNQLIMGVGNSAVPPGV